jgi:saccharopine dehydrogenase-like NADP-dependent oxidoreductase
MKIAVIGGAGAMARTIVRDLSENTRVKEILIADYQGDKAEEFAASFKDPRLKASFLDAYKIEEATELIKDYDAVINSAQYYVNISVMKACVRAGCHYNDLGGMFHTTREQRNLFDEFKQAKLTAVLGIGGAPGITNVLARYGYDQLDTVEIVRVSDAGVDMTDMKGINAFVPGYSIRTIMEEYSDEAVEFIDGEYKTLPPISGAMEIDFPEPIGRRTCIHTLHSEPATIPASFRDKGIREVTWRLSLPAEFEKKAQFLASLGFASKNPLEVEGVKVAPIEVLAAVVDKQIEDKLGGVKLKIEDMECLRAQIIGEKNGRKAEFIIDCIVGTHSRWGCSSGDVSTGVPPCIAAQMQVEGRIQPGVWGPEQAIEPEYFFRELAKREMRIQVTKKEDLT